MMMMVMPLVALVLFVMMLLAVAIVMLMLFHSFINFLLQRYTPFRATRLQKSRTH